MVPRSPRNLPFSSSVCSPETRLPPPARRSPRLPPSLSGDRGQLRCGGRCWRQTAMNCLLGFHRHINTTLWLRFTGECGRRNFT